MRAMRPSGETASATIGARVALEDLIRLLPACRPDRDPRIGSGGRHAPVLQEDDRVHRVGMKAKHLLRGFGRKRPSDGGSVETAGKDALAVGRNRDRPNRTTVACQLRSRRHRCDRQQRGNDTDANAQVHVRPTPPVTWLLFSSASAIGAKGLACRRPTGSICQAPRPFCSILPVRPACPAGSGPGDFRQAPRPTVY